MALLQAGVAGYLTDTFMARSARSIARDLRVSVLAKYLRLPGLRFDNEPVPSMLTKLGSDSDQVAQAAIDAAKVMLQQSLQVLAMLGVMLWTSWRVTLAILLLGPLLAWMMDTVGRRYRRIGHRIQESGAQLLQTADQALSSHQEVKVYGAQAVEMARYTAQANHHLKLSLKVQGQVRDAIWFGRSEPLPSQVDMAYRISVNEYQGRQSVQMIVEAIADAA